MSRHHMPSRSPRFAAGRFRRPRVLITSGVVILVILLAILGRMVAQNAMPVAANSLPMSNVLVLVLPTFLAGVLSFLSPCCLPILSAYFAFTFQADRERIVRMTITFFLGLATTMVVLGATASAISQILFAYLPLITLIGGWLVIGFGILSVLGKGFHGIQLLHQPNASFAGSYMYGATFALGWSACVGPILGAVLTLLATQGGAVLQGALLAFIYALGVGTPLIITAAWFSRLGTGTRFWRIMRGYGFRLNVGAITLHLHTTSMISGLLLIAMGYLLASGQMNVFSQWALQTPLTQWVLQLDEGLRNVFIGR